jgi:hypothetical protein
MDRGSGGRPAAARPRVPTEDFNYAASPREVARFLIGLKPIVARAIEVRQSWIKELGVLFEEARAGNAAQVTTRAGRLGREHVGAFRDTRGMAERQKPPDGCQDIQKALLQWLDGLVKASEALVEVGTTGQMAGLQVAQRHVTEARYSARRFNGEYTRLVTELRVAVRAARRR